MQQGQTGATDATTGAGRGGGLPIGSQTRTSLLIGDWSRSGKICQRRVGQRSGGRGARIPWRRSPPSGAGCAACVGTVREWGGHARAHLAVGLVTAVTQACALWATRPWRRENRVGRDCPAPRDALPHNRSASATFQRTDEGIEEAGRGAIAATRLEGSISTESCG